MVFDLLENSWIFINEIQNAAYNSHLCANIYIYLNLKERQQGLDILRVKLDFNLHVSAIDVYNSL